MSAGPLLVLAAGGTGGHMFPAQALAEEMLGRGWRVALATDARGMRYAGGFPEAVERREIRSATFARGGLTQKLAAPVTISRGVAATVAAFRRDRPAAVAGFGGYPSIPALGAAMLLGLPRMVHEQNGVLGRVNRLFAPRVHRLAAGTWPLRGLPKGVEPVLVGNPVRGAVHAAAGTPYAPAGTEGPVTLAVFGGSQGASVMARTVPQAVALLPEALRHRLRVVQQARAGEETEVAERYRAAGVAAEVAAFFEDLPARLAGAQLAIARAGASTVAELGVIGRPAILVPLPGAMDDHQTANAEALATAGGAILAPEAGLTAERLAADIARVLDAPELAARMAAAARAAARPDAAARLGDLVEALAAGTAPAALGKPAARC